MRESGGQRAQAAASHTVVRVGFLRKRQAQKAEEDEGGAKEMPGERTLQAEEAASTKPRARVRLMGLRS